MVEQHRRMPAMVLVVVAATVTATMMSAVSLFWLRLRLGLARGRRIRPLALFCRCSLRGRKQRACRQR